MEVRKNCTLEQEREHRDIQWTATRTRNSSAKTLIKNAVPWLETCFETLTQNYLYFLARNISSKQKLPQLHSFHHAPLPIKFTSENSEYCNNLSDISHISTLVADEFCT